MPESRLLAGDLARKASFSAAICASFRGQGTTTTATAIARDAMTSCAPGRAETLHRAGAQGLKIVDVLPYPKGDGPPSRLPSDGDLGTSLGTPRPALRGWRRDVRLTGSG